MADRHPLAETWGDDPVTVPRWVIYALHDAWLHQDEALPEPLRLAIRAIPPKDDRCSAIT